MEDLDRVKCLREQSGSFNEEECEASREKLMDDINNINNTAIVFLFRNCSYKWWNNYST